MEWGQTLSTQLILSNKPVMRLHCTLGIWPIINNIRHRFIFNTTEFPVSCLLKLMKTFRGFIYWLPGALLILAPPPQHSSPSLSLSCLFFIFSPTCWIPGDQVFNSAFLFVIDSFFFNRGVIVLHRHYKKIGLVTIFFQLYKTEAWEKWELGLEFWLINLFSWPKYNFIYLIQYGNMIKNVTWCILGFTLFKLLGWCYCYNIKTGEQTLLCAK